MAAPKTEQGSVREVWLSTVAAPNTKYSFLVRDDSNVKTGALFGRTIRMGDPVSLGPNSVWKQVTWEGGIDQEHWRDDAMYKSGTADTASDPGRIKLPLRIRCIHAEKKRAVTGYTFGNGTQAIAQDSFLWFGECNMEPSRTDPTSGTLVPPTGFRIYHWNPTTEVVTNFKGDHTGSITNIFHANSHLVTPATDPYIGYTTVVPTTLATTFHFIDGVAVTYVGPITGLWTSPNYPVLPKSLVAYNDAHFFGIGDQLYKRTTSGTILYSLVKVLAPWKTLRAFTVWNNRIWFATISNGGHTQVQVTDGVTTIPAFDLPDGFVPRRLVSVTGNLYVVGYRVAPLASDGVTGEVWKYSGTTLTKLWSKGDNNDGKDWGVYDAVAWKQFLVWTVPAHDPTNDKLGLYFYDAELDAISAGPSLDMHASATDYYARDLFVHRGQLVFSAWDTKNYHANVNQPSGVFIVDNNTKVRTKVTAAAYEGYSFESQSATLEKQVLSSIYQGEPEVDAENKVWLNGRLRVKIAEADSSIVVSVIINEGTEYTVSTIVYDAAATGWREVVFPIKSGGDYLVGNSIQYRLKLRNSAASVESTANPQVDQGVFEYMIKPLKRRQWSLRFLCSDGQTQLDGSANSLATTDSQRAKLEELWSSGRPIIFYEPTATGGAPAGTPVEVFISQWTEQSYRIESGQTTQSAEVGLTLTEVVVA